MTSVSMAVAKDRLSEFAAAAAAGEDVVITKHGKPYVKIVSLDDRDARLERQRRVFADVTEWRKKREPTGITTQEIVQWVREDRDA